MTGKASAVVLLSGGLDSATTLAVANREGFAVHALTLAYGQRHAAELEAARRVAQSIGVSAHIVQTIDLRVFGGSALTDDMEVPKSRSLDGTDGIPITYVPARNTIFLALALGYAETVGAQAIFIGVSAVDYSGYPDCRPVFIETFERLANVATKAGIDGWQYRIQAPLLHLTKAQTIRLGLRLGVDYALTHTCYDPSPERLACGRCDSCRLRRKGFLDVGVDDPLPYVGNPSKDP